MTEHQIKAPITLTPAQTEFMSIMLSAIVDHTAVMNFLDQAESEAAPSDAGRVGEYADLAHGLAEKLVSAQFDQAWNAYCAIAFGDTE